MTLGEKIRIARTKKNMSQQDLSEKAGTHQKNISKYEKDLVVPSALTLKSMADALDVTTDYLLGNEENTIKDTSLLKQFNEIDHLPEDTKSPLMIIINSYLRDYKTQLAYSNK